MKFVQVNKDTSLMYQSCSKLIAKTSKQCTESVQS